MSRIRANMTFANVTSLLALFVALGGTAGAALLVTGKNVKNGSLTGVDIKNGSLKSVDVGDGSLLAQDFKAGQLPAGQKGDTGLQGPKGDQGNPGVDGQNGATGPRGPSDAWVGAGVTLDDGPGKYLLVARASITNNTANPASVACQFNVTGYTDGGSQTYPGVATVPASAQATVPVLGWVEIGAGQPSVTVSCSGGLSTTVSILATKVATLTHTPSN